MASKKKAITVRSATRTSASTAISAGSASAGSSRAPIKPIKPPLETALDAFARELRAALDQCQAHIEKLRTDLAAAKADLATFRGRYNQHTHGYAQGNPGSGGLMWFSLGQMRSYFDDDKTIWDGQGVYLRGGPVSGSPGPIQTDPPSSAA